MAQTGVRLAIDAMGGDLGPAEVVAAVAEVRRNLKTVDEVVLVGRESELSPLLGESGLAQDRAVTLHPAEDIIGMEEKPMAGVRRRNSSMMQALELVRSGQCRAALSCGNTGVLMAGGTIRLRPMDGVERPALATVIPSKDNHFILLDAGANPTAGARHLVHNAVLGSHYARIALGISRPRIGLLTIGTEEGKGHEQIFEAHEHLKKTNGMLDYVGLLEGFQCFENAADVLVTDGFTGNLLLKSWENLFHMLTKCIREEISRQPHWMLGGLLSKGAFRSVKNRLSPELYGGAPLLGLKGTVIKAHGSSNRTAIFHAIRIASEAVAHDMNAHARDDIANANTTMELAIPEPAQVGS